MVAVVSLDFGVSGGVVKGMGHFSQGVEGAPPGLEELDKPLQQGGGGLL